MDLREAQRPLKERYRAEPAEARITLTARGGETTGAAACSVDIGRAVYAAQAHAGVGGEGTPRAPATSSSARWPPARR